MSMSESIPNLPTVISELFQSKDPELQKQGYTAFLKRTHWLASNDPNHLKQVACSQLGVSTNKVTCSRVKIIQPGLLWSSQSGLEADKLNMVTDAAHYFKINNLEFPPIIVWNFFDSQKVKYVVHDGHHRADRKSVV